MKRIIYAEDAMQNVMDEIRYKESLYTSTVYSIAKKAISSAPTVDQRCLQPVEEWISVNDTLPDFFDEVLVYNSCCDDSGISIAWREPGNNGGWVWNSRMVYPDDLVGVTHWMPLPKPPEVPHD